MKKWTRNEQILVVVMIGIAGVFFFSKNIHDPLSKDIHELVKKNNEVVGNIKELQEIPTETKPLEIILNHVRDELDSVRILYDSLVPTMLIDRSRLQERALDLSSLLADNGITVLEFEYVQPKIEVDTKSKKRSRRKKIVEESEHGGTHQSILHAKWQKKMELSEYRLKLEGDYMNFIGFVNEVRNKFPQLVFDKLKVSGANDQGYVLVECALYF